MTYSGLEKKLNKEIFNTLNGHRHFNMDKITTNFGHMLEYCKKSSSFCCVKSYMSVANFINNFRCSGFITAWKNICFVMWNGMPRLVVQ